jgi:hypothetical protein
MVMFAWVSPSMPKTSTKGFAIVRAFPKFETLPIVLSESDPEGCAACSARVYPQNAYRNGALYASYTAAMMKNIFELADRRRTNIEGMLTWAFEFEDQPYFDGFRTLATNGIDKPVLNVFRMAALMRGDRVKTESSGRTPLDTMLAEGVRGNPDVDALAVRSDRGISVLTWNYHDDDVPAAEAKVRLEIAGVPSAATRVLVRHYRIDETTAMPGRRGRPWDLRSIRRRSSTPGSKRPGSCSSRTLRGGWMCERAGEAGVFAPAPGCLSDGAELVRICRCCWSLSTWPVAAQPCVPSSPVIGSTQTRGAPAGGASAGGIITPLMPAM